MRTDAQRNCHRNYMRKWNALNHEKVTARARMYHANHKDERNRKKRERYATDDSYKKMRKERKRQYYLRNRNRVIEMVGKYERTFRDRVNEKQRSLTAKVKNQVIEAYGGKCSCCGESDRHFLSIDHIHGRKQSIDALYGQKTYAWLRKNGFPKDGFRLLCMNCNFSFGVYGFCPHQQVPRVIS